MKRLSPAYASVACSTMLLAAVQAPWTKSEVSNVPFTVAECASDEPNSRNDADWQSAGGQS